MTYQKKSNWRPVDYSFIVLGMLLGCFVFNIATYFGEQRYSQAIQQCVQWLGPNK